MDVIQSLVSERRRKMVSISPAQERNAASTAGSNSSGRARAGITVDDNAVGLLAGEHRLYARRLRSAS